MPKKGCSPDNVRLAKGFFGRMKQEMFYGRGWSGASMEEFMKAANGCLV